MAGAILLLGLFDGAGDVPSSDPVFYDVLEEVQTVIEDLTLDGSPTVLLRKVPVDQGIGSLKETDFPVIIVAPWKDQLPIDAGTNLKDDVTYDVMVLMIDRDNREGTLQGNLNRTALWRTLIRRALHHQAFDVDSVYDVIVTPLEFIIREAWAIGYFSSAVVVSCVSRETRVVA